MRYTEEEIWNLTPRKFKAQLEVHNYIQKCRYGEAKDKKAVPHTGYIDQIPGW